MNWGIRVTSIIRITLLTWACPFLSWTSKSFSLNSHLKLATSPFSWILCVCRLVIRFLISLLMGPVCQTSASRSSSWTASLLSFFCASNSSASICSTPSRALFSWTPCLHLPPCKPVKCKGEVIFYEFCIKCLQTTPTWSSNWVSSRRVSNFSFLFLNLLTSSNLFSNSSHLVISAVRISVNSAFFNWRKWFWVFTWCSFWFSCQLPIQLLDSIIQWWNIVLVFSCLAISLWSNVSSGYRLVWRCCRW